MPVTHGTHPRMSTPRCRHSWQVHSTHTHTRSMCIHGKYTAHTDTHAQHVHNLCQAFMASTRDAASLACLCLSRHGRPQHRSELLRLWKQVRRASVKGAMCVGSSPERYPECACLLSTASLTPHYCFINVPGFLSRVVSRVCVSPQYRFINASLLLH